MKYFKTLISICLILSLTNCKNNRTRHKQKVGLWISKDSVGKDFYKYIYHYRKGVEVKTSKIFKNYKIFRTEKFKNDICYVTYFYENGKIMTTGTTMAVLETETLHWYYFGEWKDYDENGKVIKIKTYENGKLISTSNLQ